MIRLTPGFKQGNPARSAFLLTIASTLSTTSKPLGSASCDLVIKGQRALPACPRERHLSDFCPPLRHLRPRLNADPASNNSLVAQTACNSRNSENCVSRKLLTALPMSDQRLTPALDVAQAVNRAVARFARRARRLHAASADNRAAARRRAAQPDPCVSPRRPNALHQRAQPHTTAAYSPATQRAMARSSSARAPAVK